MIAAPRQPSAITQKAVRTAWAICQRSRTPAQSAGGACAFQSNWSRLMGALTTNVTTRASTSSTSAAAAGRSAGLPAPRARNTSTTTAMNVGTKTTPMNHGK